MSDIIQRLTSLLSTNNVTFGTSAVQISGGPPANWPLTNVSSTFYPNYHRQVLRIANDSPTATLYVGSTSSVTSSSGYFAQIGPGLRLELNISGSVPVWVIASAASTPGVVEELN